MPARKSTRPRSPRASAQEKIEAERRQLNKAVAVLIGAELTAEYCPDMPLVTDAISVARNLVEGAVSALDSVNLSKATSQEP